jgi:hypothetical protein
MCVSDLECYHRPCITNYNYSSQNGAIPTAWLDQWLMHDQKPFLHRVRVPLDPLQSRTTTTPTAGLMKPYLWMIAWLTVTQLPLFLVSERRTNANMMLRKAVGAPTLAATRLVRCSARVISFCEGANAWRAISTASWGASGIAETRVRSAGCVGPGIPRVHGTQWLARRSLLSGTHTHRDDVAIDRSTSAANKAREAPADLTADGSQDFAHITTGLREYMIKTYKGTTKVRPLLSLLHSALARGIVHASFQLLASIPSSPCSPWAFGWALPQCASPPACSCRP